MEAARAMAQRLRLEDAALVLSRLAPWLPGTPGLRAGANGFCDKATDFESFFTPVQQHFSQKGLAP